MGCVGCGKPASSSDGGWRVRLWLRPLLWSFRGWKDSMQRRIRQWLKIMVRMRMKKMKTAWKAGLARVLEIASARSVVLLVEMCLME